jgi:hypothetical protein
MLFLTAIVALLIALMLWYGNKPVEIPLATSTETNIASETSESRPPVPSVVIHTNAPAVNTRKAITAANVPKPSPESKMDRMQGILSTYNDVPIDFYGKLEDQFGNPVVGADIKGSIRVIGGVRQGTDWLTTTSDANGLFQFHGKGQDISTMPSKKGYALASLNGGGNYSMLAPEEERANPDPSNPVVIKMWKLQGAEPLLSINQQYRLRYTDAPINFDLLTGKIVPAGGDVKLTVNRSPGVISGRNRLDWSVQIEAVDGGVMDSSGRERVTYTAPKDGYQSSMTFIFSANAPYKWFGGFNQGFIVMSRNAQVYSKVGLSFDINDAPDGFMSITFRGIANTNSSRNWEGDPNTMNAVAK